MDNKKFSVCVDEFPVHNPLTELLDENRVDRLLNSKIVEICLLLMQMEIK